MPAHAIKDRLVPYKLLGYLLYARPGELEWLEAISEDEVRVITGDCARTLRMKSAALWEAFYWLEEYGLVKQVRKERKRGTAILKLRQPTNIKCGECDG